MKSSLPPLLRAALLALLLTAGGSAANASADTLVARPGSKPLAADLPAELAMLLGVKYKQDARGQFIHLNLITILNSEGEIAHQHAGLMGDMSQAAKIVGLRLR